LNNTNGGQQSCRENCVFAIAKSLAEFIVAANHLPTVNSSFIGVSASKKIGNAVVRNRMRRMIKEIVRHQEHRIIPGIDLILIVRKPATLMKMKDMEKSVLHVLKKAGLLKLPAGQAAPKRPAKPEQ
jgi:ribonuclease P protein component